MAMTKFNTDSSSNVILVQRVPSSLVASAALRTGCWLSQLERWRPIYVHAWLTSSFLREKLNNFPHWQKYQDTTSSNARRSYVRKTAAVASIQMQRESHENLQNTNYINPLEALRV